MQRARQTRCCAVWVSGQLCIQLRRGATLPPIGRTTFLLDRPWINDTRNGRPFSRTTEHQSTGSSWMRSKYSDISGSSSACGGDGDSELDCRDCIKRSELSRFWTILFMQRTHSRCCSTSLNPTLHQLLPPLAMLYYAPRTETWRIQHNSYSRCFRVAKRFYQDECRETEF